MTSERLARRPRRARSALFAPSTQGPEQAGLGRRGLERAEDVRVTGVDDGHHRAPVVPVGGKKIQSAIFAHPK